MEPTVVGDFYACPCLPEALRGWISTRPTIHLAPSTTLQPVRCHHNKTTSQCVWSRARRSTGTGTADADVRYIGHWPRWPHGDSQSRGIAHVKKTLLTMAALMVTATG